MTAFIWIFLGGGVYSGRVYRSAVLGLQWGGLQECSTGATVGGSCAQGPLLKPADGALYHQK